MTEEPASASGGRRARLDLGGRVVLREHGEVLAQDDDRDAVFGVAWRGNPLREQLEIQADWPGRSILAWSGTLGGELFAADPRTWLRPGHEALAAVCERLGSTLLDQRRRLCFHPHARHVLSDPVSCQSFLREHEHGPFDVALAPGSMLVPSMTCDVEDHLRRSFEMLGPLAALVILAEEPPAGSLPTDQLLALLDDHVPAEIPVLLRTD